MYSSYALAKRTDEAYQLTRRLSFGFGDDRFLPVALGGRPDYRGWQVPPLPGGHPPALAQPANLCHYEFMASRLDERRRLKRGRPPVESKAVTVRISAVGLKELDDWRRTQTDLPGRPEAIRRLVEIGLSRGPKNLEGQLSGVAPAVQSQFELDL